MIAMKMNPKTRGNPGKKKKSMDKRFIKTGVAQFGVGVSISPIEIVRHTNTNKAGVQEGKNAGMAPLRFPYCAARCVCYAIFHKPELCCKIPVAPLTM